MDAGCSKACSKRSADGAIFRHCGGVTTELASKGGEWHLAPHAAEPGDHCTGSCAREAQMADKEEAGGGDSLDEAGGRKTSPEGVRNSGSREHMDVLLSRSVRR